MSDAPTGPNFTSADALLPAIAQDHITGEILMLAYMNQEAYEQTLAGGEAVYFSRSKGRFWKKGEHSGNVQIVHQVLVDCDQDAILLRVEQRGPGACHKGYKSCFFSEATPEGLQIVQEKTYDPEKTYG